MPDINDEIVLPTVKNIKNLLEPIYLRLDAIMRNLKEKEQVKQNKYYRNADIKKLLGISNNTIIKYRENRILPYTKLGDVYLYEVKAIDAILEKNKI